jgi:hypothetical protein
MLYVASVAYDQAQEVGADGGGPSCVREAKRAWRPPHACTGACVPQQEVGPDRQAQQQECTDRCSSSVAVSRLELHACAARRAQAKWEA